MIYFVANPDGSRIKIGTTIRLSIRLKQLAAEHGDGLKVMAVMDGGRDEEQGLHRRFASLRDVGEWFEPGDDLLAFIVSDGREWRGEDEAPPNGTPVRLTDDAVKWARIASGYTGESMAEYVSRIVVGAAKADADRLHAEAVGTAKKAPKPKGAEK